MGDLSGGRAEGSIALRGGSGKIFHRSEKDPIWGLKGRRRYCRYYQAGLLTSQQIWQALDQFYANKYANILNIILPGEMPIRSH
jgi:hypothetical protein